MRRLIDGARLHPESSAAPPVPPTLASWRHGVAIAARGTRRRRWLRLFRETLARQRIAGRRGDLLDPLPSKRPAGGLFTSLSLTARPLVICTIAPRFSPRVTLRKCTRFPCSTVAMSSRRSEDERPFRYREHVGIGGNFELNIHIVPGQSGIRAIDRQFGHSGAGCYRQRRARSSETELQSVCPVARAGAASP